jgi:tetratricopeptide (TPR) repeat protein
MNIQGNLFPSGGAGFKPDLSLKEPLVWVRRLVLLREFKPGDENIIRRIELRPGLNILWARPRTGQGAPKLGEKGVYGHASGKTTFCRLLRHVLGEKHFGNTNLTNRIRDRFPRGWVVGEIRLKGESWLVCRPFSVGPHSFVVRGAEIEKLFDEGLQKEQLSVYQDALNAVLMERMLVATFATSPEPIEWPHLMQWLVRDQECRYADLTDFRHKSSESESPDMDVEDRHFLFRAALDLINTAEQEELERNKALVSKKQSAEKRAPLLRHQAQVAYNRLRAELPDQHNELSGELYLDAVKKSLEAEDRDLTKNINGLKEPTELRTAREAASNAQAQKQRMEDRTAELREAIEGLQKELDVLQGRLSQKAFDDYLASKTKSAKLCLEPLARALAMNCPLAVGKTLPEESGRVALKIERKAEDVEKAIEAQKKQLKEIEKQVGVLADKVKTTQTAWANEQEKFNAVRDKLMERRLQVRGTIRRAIEAKDDDGEADKLEKSVGTLEKEIRKSLEKQTKARQQQMKALSDFSETFDRVTKAILGVELSASVHFDGRQLATEMNERGDLTSAAIETLKILAFDLAALISGIEGRGFHPRLLIHDGPREADMAADLYQKIFLLARELEIAFGNGGTPSFQYIVTTTEPPPEDLQIPPWRVEPVLDASTKDGRLFKEDL